MEKEPLNQNDRIIVKSAIQEKIVGSVFIGLIVIILVSVIIGLIYKTENLIPENLKLVTSIGLIILSIIGFIGFLYISIKDNLRELRQGDKEVISGKVNNKILDTNYSYSMNPVVDAKYQPRINEGYIELQGKWIGVAEKDFKNIEIGDFVRIFLSPKTRIVLGLERKEKETPPNNVSCPEIGLQ